MRLNPLAAEFVPASTWQPPYTGWGLNGNSPRAAGKSPGLSSIALIASDPPADLNIMDLPEEVVAEVVGKLRNPADVLALALVSRKMGQTVKGSFLRLRIEKRHLGTPHSFLSASSAILPGVLELDLSGCENVEGRQLLEAIQQMPRLKLLNVSGCRKLTSEFANPALGMRQLRNGREPGHGTVGGLQALGMQRCFRFDAQALSHLLDAASSSHSQLQAATLSHLSLLGWPSLPAVPSYPTDDTPLPRMAAAHRIPCASLKVLALNNCSKIAADGLAYLSACCPDLAYLMLGGSTLDTLREQSGAHEALAPLVDPGMVHEEHCPGMYQNTKATSTARLAGTVVEAAQGLAKLKALELTFFHPEVVAEVAAGLTGVEVWDFTSLGALEAARASTLNTSCDGPGLTLALKAAANCSSGSRCSPLHAAVEADCCRSLQAVLELGGQLESKDRSGATPLFLACEMGKLVCACALMAAGADLQTRNSAGEAPLYIAALKGHERIVEELLKEFRERSLRWTDATYGDDWNPLMAAAVADRHAIAVRLLRSAGCAKRLVTATNRYGQTAAHIAARRGGNMLLLALCNAGGMDIAKIKDNSKKTPLDIARAHRHEAAVSILKYGTHTPPQLPMRGHKL